MGSTNRISIAEAARRLTEAGDRISRPGLSIYLSQHAEAGLFVEEAGRRVVDFERLVAHRAENIRIRAKPSPSPAADDPRPAAKAPSVRFSGTQADGAARKAMADAELRELDLAERRGELVAASEVDRAGREAIALMQAAFEHAIESDAASLSVKYGLDERIARIALKSFMRRGLDEFHRIMLERLDDLRRAEQAGEAGPGELLS
jgi:hypothetical protein